MPSLKLLGSIDDELKRIDNMISLTDTIWTAIILISILINHCNGQGTPFNFTTSHKQAILNFHNNFRNTVAGGFLPPLPPATNMNELLWDEGLAQLAGQISETCDQNYIGSTTADLSFASFAQPDTPENLGANLLFDTSSATWPNILILIFNQWNQDESSAYQYGTVNGDAQCTAENGCDRWTQVIWANTRYLGCGVSDCSIVNVNITTYIICLYYQAGNVVGEYPYEDAGDGFPCDNCDSDRTAICADGNAFTGSSSNVCGGGVYSAFAILGGTRMDVDNCDNGLGEALFNCTIRTRKPSIDPTVAPTIDPTISPTSDPTVDPTADPTNDPTFDPTIDLTVDPTIDPTTDPTIDPTTDPTADSTTDPSIDPTADPTVDPTSDPTADPTIDPTTDPTIDPTVDPTIDPTTDPTIDPTVDPTADPTIDPTVDPTLDPTLDPTTDPTIDPTIDPTTDPTADPTICPTTDPSADPTFDPTTHPTTSPVEIQLDSVLVAPTACQDKCDAFSVFIDSYRYDQNGNLCITYDVDRLFATGLCRKSIEYIILGLCQDDIGDASYNDINEIIQDFDLIDNDRRRLGSGSYSKDSSRGWSSSYDDNKSKKDKYSSANNDDITGVLINVNIAASQSFELCLQDVFLDPPQFSDTVRFKRGKSQFTCSDDAETGENYLQGLPCLDSTKFAAGGYGYSRALTNNEETTNDNWGALSNLDPMIRWLLISIFIVFGLLIIVSGYICIIQRKKDKGNNMKEAIEMATHIGNLPSTTFNKSGESFTQDYDGEINNNSNTMNENENEDDKDIDIEYEDEFFDGDEIDLEK